MELSLNKIFWKLTYSFYILLLPYNMIKIYQKNNKYEM